MKKLSRHAVRRLRQVQRQILLEPELYDQNAFAGSSENPCGTACCIAGWIIWNNNPQEYVSGAQYGGCDFWSKSEEILGVNVSDLFACADDWNEPFASQYASAKTKLDQAKVASARIDHFIAMGGAK